MADIDKLIKSYIPMSEPAFLVLTSLLDARHGYGIMQYVHELTKGRVNLGAGTVYTILYKMENDDLIRVVREEDRRKVYCITSTGREVLKVESQRIAGLSNLAKHTLGRVEERGCAAI